MKEMKTLVDLLNNMPGLYKRREVTAGKKNGIWMKYSPADFRKQVDALSFGLIKLGIEPGDRVGIMSPNRPEWNMVDFAVQQICAVSVPLQPTMAEHDLAYILNDAEVKILFVADVDLYYKAQKLRAELPSLITVYSFNDVGGAPSWVDVKELGEAEDVSQLPPPPKAADLLTLIYTSGTTGNPKGVMLTHDNLVSNVIACRSLLPEGTTKVLSFLPLGHIFERMIVYIYMSAGASVYYAENMDTIVVNLAEVKPDCFSTVPRLLEKVYDRIVAKGEALTGLKRNIFFWALNLGLKYEHDGKNGFWYGLQLQLARKLIFSKWQDALGGNILAIVSGGAALQDRLARVFTAAGIPVLEGYGLTETSPVIAVNRLDKGMHCFGTVGEVIKGVEVQIADDGEILCKGPNVMLGYYKDEAKTAEVMQDGWFHTGDIGMIVQGRYLKITDRKKEMFKTAGGKYIAPQPIENKLKESTFIEQVMVIGENQRFPAALIVPTFPTLKIWADERLLPHQSLEDLLVLPAVNALYQAELDRCNQDLSKWERPKKFVLLPKEWTIDGGELTPKLSLKRKVILENCKDCLEKIYKHDEQSVEPI